MCHRVVEYELLAWQPLYGVRALCHIVNLGKYAVGTVSRIALLNSSDFGHCSFCNRFDSDLIVAVQMYGAGRRHGRERKAEKLKHQ
jgi:hypothetical protein